MRTLRNPVGTNCSLAAIAADTPLFVTPLTERALKFSETIFRHYMTAHRENNDYGLHIKVCARTETVYQE